MCSVSTDLAPRRLATGLYLVKVSALACLLFPLLPAQAGSYTTPGPTGGQGTVTPSGPPAQPYGNVQDGYGASVYSGSVQSASATCSGPITTVYTWQPDYPGEAPPQQVVVDETCTAECDGQNYGQSGPGSPTCDDGLGDDSAVSSSPLYDESQNPPAVVGTQVSATSAGTRCKIMSGAQTITVTCSPKASLSVNDGPARAHVAYSVSISPLELMLTGGIGPNGAKRYLIGQQCTATLDSAA